MACRAQCASNRSEALPYTLDWLRDEVIGRVAGPPSPDGVTEMHKIHIPDKIVARVIRRQGRWNVHDDVPPQETAFVVVDMQNYFMAPGQQVEIPTAREIVPNINRLAHALRDAGGLVIWIRTISNEDSFRNWAHF